MDRFKKIEEKLLSSHELDNIGIRKLLHEIEYCVSFHNFISKQHRSLPSILQNDNDIDKLFKLQDDILTDLEKIDWYNLTPDQQLSKISTLKGMVDNFINYSKNTNLTNILLATFITSYYPYAKEFHNLNAISMYDLLMKDIDGYKIEYGEKKREINNILQKEKEDAQEITRKKISEAYKNQFNKLSVSYHDLAKNWLIASSVTLGLLIVILLLFYFLAPHHNSSIDIQYLSFKVSTIIFISWSLFVCIKNYNNSKNLAFIYEQKHVMLDTYNAFLLTLDDEVKSKFAAEVGRIIFEVVDTGYIKNQADSNPTIIGTIENIMRGSKGN